MNRSVGVEPKWAGRAVSPGSQSLCPLRAPAAPQLMRIGSVIGITPAGRDYQLTRDGCDYLCAHRVSSVTLLRLLAELYQGDLSKFPRFRRIWTCRRMYFRSR